MTDPNELDPVTDFSDEQLALLTQMLAAEGVAASGSATIVARSRPDSVPLSFAQELVWLLDRASPGMTAYNSGLARRIRGSLDLSALQGALDALAARHEVLRTTYPSVHDQPVQVVHAPRAVPVAVVDLGHLPATTRESEARRTAINAIRTPLNLAQDAPLRVTLIRLDDNDHVLTIGMHHIAIDGWSRSILFRELGQAYEAIRRGEALELPALPLQYADFAIWQREHLAGPRLDALLGFWRAQLADANDELALPTDFPRPAHAGFEGAQVTQTLAPALTAGMRELAKRHAVTLYMLLLAAYQTVLHRWTGQEDILTGSPVAGRGLPETAGVLGYFANILVMRGRFADDPSFAELLPRFRETALTAFEHQEVPLEKLMLELRDSRARSTAAPLFRAVLTMHDMATGDLRLGDLELSSIGMESDSSKFDLTFIVADQPDGIRFTLHYRTDLFRSETAERFVGHVQQVLQAAIADASVRVSKIPIVTTAEAAALAAWNSTAAELGAPASVVTLFEAQVARVPTKAAVVTTSATGEHTALSYRQLNARANQLAHALRRRGVEPQSRVGLLLDRSADAIVGLVGILKTGGCYVPLSLDAPPERLKQQLTECGAEWVVTDSSMLDRIPATVAVIALDRDADELAAQPDTNPPAATEAHQLAYVLHTSGSTGVPKGVAVTHANIVHYSRAVSRVLERTGTAVPADPLSVNDGRRFGLASTLAADLGHTALYPALLSGAELHVLNASVTTEPARFAEYLNSPGLDVLKITPNHWQALAAGKRGGELAAILPAEWLVFGGEALRPDLARDVLAARKCRVLNHYGPTETTVGACTFEATSESLAAAIDVGAQTVPLGRPLSNGHAYVVDANDNEQPVGVPGELVLGGPGVAAGYFNRPELTAERFVSWRSERVYRTGDRVRRLIDGTIEFLGRGDDQVKVRGFRVELGDIEQAVRAHTGVAQCAVLLRADGNGEPALVAYVVPRTAGYAAAHAERLTTEHLREWVRSRLPEYMVPTTVVLLDQLPLNRNGKLDRAALAASDVASGSSAAFVAPRTATESGLATIWSDVLKKEQVSVTASFLELGGHSLLAIRVLGRVSKAFGVRLPLRTLFESPTIGQLAKTIDDAVAAGGSAAAVPAIKPRARGTSPTPATTDGDPA